MCLSGGLLQHQMFMFPDVLPWAVLSQWAGLIVVALQVRQHVNALGAAFSRRSNEAQASTLAHQLSLGVFALEDALTHGRPYAAAASQVAHCAPDDELVASACRALPEGTAKKVRCFICLCPKAVRTPQCFSLPVTFAADCNGNI